MPDVFQKPPVLNRSCSTSLRRRHLFFPAMLILPGVFLVPTSAQAQMTALESVQVRTGSAVRLKTPLEAGELYLLKASGTVQVGTEQVDAEAVTGIGADAAVPAQSSQSPQNTQAQPAPKHGRWVGGSGHTYYMIVSGVGQPPSFRLLTPRAQTGKGAITISVFRLSPAPALPAPPLASLQVPVLDRSVATSLITRLGTLYLIQASGSGRVGGGGLGQGDAEYMDYNAGGTGAVDIGDANTDYGLGVDEADQSVSPRLHKWGAWRKDHTYYLLFAGTGQPIHFFFYDVKGGYGDNSPTDTLTVRVFPVP